MTNLETEYMGLRLRTPFIAGSSSLTHSIEKIKELGENGIGAIVLKSIFEEQINQETAYLQESQQAHTEEAEYLQGYLQKQSLNDYLELIRKAKQVTDVPIIASVCCTSEMQWIDMAKSIEQVGADAIEVNAFLMPFDTTEGGNIEDRYLDILRIVRTNVSIPVAMKISKQFTNVASFAYKLYSEKVDGIVMFNRFYHPDIDIDKQTITSAPELSSENEYTDTLRWTGIVASKVPQIDIASGTGIHSAETAIKMILAGATAIQICSVLYLKNITFVKELCEKTSAWMDKMGYSQLDECRGRLSYDALPNPAFFERVQFMKWFEKSL